MDDGRAPPATTPASDAAGPRPGPANPGTAGPSDPVPAPLGSAELPERRGGVLALVGPGAVLVGLSIGAGELVLWPWITAKFGAVMVWAAALGILLQLFVNLEVGRFAIATGEAPYTGFARIWMGFVWGLVTLSVLGLFLPGWARISGGALKALVFGPDGPGADWMWTALTFVAIAALLFGPKVMYAAVERTVTVLVALMTLGLIFVAVQVGTLEGLREMGRGLLNIGHVELDDEFTALRFFGALVYAGAGGAANLWYAFYLRDKGVGMGARIPALANPIRAADDAETRKAPTGFLFPDTPENRGRFRAWYRFVVWDQVLFFWLLNSFTMFLFMFGALCVLRPAGAVPSEGRILWDSALILSETLGVAGRYVFLLIGMAALFSTQLVIVDGNARTWAYILDGTTRVGRRVPQNRLYGVFAVGIMGAGVLGTWFFERFAVTGLGFVFNSALLGGLAMALYVPLLLYMNLRVLPPSARPGPLNVAAVVCAGVVYGVFALYSLWVLFPG